MKSQEDSNVGCDEERTASVMRGRYQAYPEYKDSEVEWLGSIPAHWEVMQLKRTVDGCVNGIWGTEPNKDGGDTIVIRVADFDRARLTVKDDDEYTYRRIEGKEKANRRLKQGDLLLEKSGGGERTLVGQVVLFDKQFEAVTSNFVAKMSPNSGFDSRYLNYVFSRFYRENINLPSIKQNTGIQNLDSGSYLAEQFGFPEKDEQSKIANFLDHETAKIDTLIEKQQLLIKLLKEKRQAVISHAVTKGLNHDAPMRDSGVEWLGEVPEHWEVARFKHLITDRAAGPYGSSLTKSMYTSSGIRVYGQQQVIPDDFSIGDYYISKEKFEEMKRYEVNPGDILISVMGTVGKVAVVPKGIERGIINPRLVKYRVMEEKVLSGFAKATILSDVSQSQLLFAAQGSTMDGLNMQIIGELPIAYPTIDEQLKILNEVSRQGEKFDVLLKHAERAVYLLKERRIALISAAVTGKIDVRDWTAPEQQPNNQHAA